MTYNKLSRVTMQAALALALSGVAPGAGAGTGNAVIYLFHGTPPTDIDAALDITNTTGPYTLLGAVVSNPVGPVGLSFADNTASGVLAKHAAETWDTGTLGAFVGGLVASSSASIDFILICTLADNGHSLNTTRKRVMATIAQIDSGVDADILLASNVVTVGSSFGFDGFAFV